MLLNEPLLYCALRAVAFHVSSNSTRTLSAHALPAEAWDALATLATPTGRPVPAVHRGRRNQPAPNCPPAAAGRAGHPEGRSGAEDGAAVDAPGS